MKSPDLILGQSTFLERRFAAIGLLTSVFAELPLPANKHQRQQLATLIDLWLEEEARVLAELRSLTGVQPEGKMRFVVYMVLCPHCVATSAAIRRRYAKEFRRPQAALFPAKKNAEAFIRKLASDAPDLTVVRDYPTTKRPKLPAPICPPPHLH